jgi:hypothetical protein
MRFFRRRRRPDDLAGKQRQIADLFVNTASQLAGLTFDYSQASVDDLDGWVDRLWDPHGPPPSEAELDSNTKLIGAYLGEVMIRHWGGDWVWNSDPEQPAVETNGMTVLVLNRAYKRQVNGSQASISDFYAEMRRADQN